MSRQIWQRCRALPFFHSSPLLCSYIGFGEEVETAGELRGLLADGMSIAVPTLRCAGGKPAFAELTSWDDLAPNSLGILEPACGARIVPAAEIPLFLVPGVAFDARGGRLGYGLGFYDRALVGASPEAMVVGLAFDLQIVKSVPVESHDRVMDMTVTEQRLIEAPLRAGSAKEVC